MYTSYNAYNHCNACQPTYLSEKIDIIRQQTADLREKIIFLEEHFNNQNQSMSLISTTLNNDLESTADKMYPCNYCPQVYPIAMPQYYPSQYDQLESLAPLSPLDPTPLSPSHEPGSLRYAVQMQNTENHELDTTVTENWESKINTLQLNNTDRPIIMNDGNQCYANTSTSSQGECKEILQLCLTLINDLRDARTELATIVNKCLEDRPKLNRQLLCQLCSVKEDDQKSFIGRKSRHTLEDKKKILNESSKERKINSYPPMDKKINKVTREVKFTKEQESDESEDGNKDAVLTILINCLETMKISKEVVADVEGMNMLGRKIKIESGCKCTAEKKKSTFFKKEEMSGLCCFNKPTLSKCLCLHQATSPTSLLPAEPHESQSNYKPCTCMCNVPSNEPAKNNQSVIEAEKVDVTKVKSITEDELAKVAELTKDTEDKDKNIKNGHKSKGKHNGKGKEREEEEQDVNNEAKEKIEETEKPQEIGEPAISGETVGILSKDACSCPTDKPNSTMDNRTKPITFQDCSGGCCCQGERQQFCKCGPYLDPPCGRESITVTRKCMNKPAKAAKEPKSCKPKPKHRNRPCFHTWPERTRCLKRFINHPCP